MKKRFSKILVTGGAGFIGNYIVSRLLDDSYDVTVIDDFSKGRIENLSIHQGKENFHIVRGDIRDFELVKRVMKDVDAVFHEAAFVSIVLSIEDPLLVHEMNVTSTLNLLKAAVDSNAVSYTHLTLPTTPYV